MFLVEHIINLPGDFIKGLLSIDELIDYTEGMLSKDIDGELIRSYLIVYKDGINEVWNELKKQYTEYQKVEITESIELTIEEALEQINFDELFFTEIHDIKNKQNI